MSQLVQALNDNAGAIQVIFSALVTLATLVYAFLTWKLVTETRRLRRAQTDAKVMAGIGNRKDAMNFIEFFVRNEGVGPAYDIQFQVEPVSPDQGDPKVTEKIKALGFIDNGLDYLAPQQEIRTFLTSMFDNFQDKIETALNVKVSYRNATGEKSTDSFCLDFSIFKGLVQLGKPDLYSIAKSMEKIQKDIKKISSAFPELKVITQSKTNWKEEQQKDYEETMKYFEEQKNNKAKT